MVTLQAMPIWLALLMPIRHTHSSIYWMEWVFAMWLYPQLWGFQMQAKDSLAAVLRVLRRARGLKAEDFANHIAPTHVNNLENGKVSVTLETLQSVSAVLDVRPITLLILAESFRGKVSPADMLVEIEKELNNLASPAMLKDFAGQMEGDQLVRRPSGAQLSQEKLSAVRECKAQGMTQREAVLELGFPTSTVQRYWHKE
ncbi:helix-turn-helix transcriptional regulator [Pseudomonas syringae]|nr:helix-turn-helix transcriptional regulator [Pseudomonas syringae]MBD8801837.1 helix-turn-helix transcriptional regulator [Pseudomonas syringae]MBD8811813.1 helix-turn-helix transcriptional regulator [Pseudomonas syringae]